MEETLTIIEKTAFLKGMEALKAVPTESLADMAALAHEKRFEAGETVCSEGQPNPGVFLVVEGKLEERKGKALVRVIPPYTAVGELWLTEGEPLEYTVTALEPTLVLHVRSEDVFDSLGDHPEIALAVVRDLASQVHDRTERILELEKVVDRLNQACIAAGIDPPDLRTE